MSENGKHRIIGFLVIFSLIIIIAPIMLQHRANRFAELNINNDFSVPAPLPATKQHDPLPLNQWPSSPLSEAQSNPSPKSVATKNNRAVQPPLAITKVQHTHSKLPRTPVLIKKASSHMTLKPKANHVIGHKKTQQRYKKHISKPHSNHANRFIYSVQLASFSDPQNAKRLVKQLTKTGEKTYLKTSKTMKGDLLTQVFVGRFAIRGKAENYVAYLFKKVKLKGLIIKG